MLGHDLRIQKEAELTFAELVEISLFFFFEPTKKKANKESIRIHRTFGEINFGTCKSFFESVL